MNLAKMLERVEYECISGTTDVEITPGKDPVGGFPGNPQ